MKLKQIYRLAVSLLATLVTVSCASGPTAEDGTGEVQRVCFNSNLVRNFDAIDDEHVYVQEGRDRHFLLTMRVRCHDLRGAISIAISDTTNRICSKSFGKILYRDSLGGRRLESCHIGTVEQVNSKEHAEHIVDTRTGPPDEDAGGTLKEIPPEQ